MSESERRESVDRRIEVAIPVFVTVGSVHLRLFPYTEREDIMDALPWAWGAMCRLKFHFGDLVTSKKVQTRYAYNDRLGWAQERRPSDASLAEGRSAVLDSLRVQVARHGFKPPEFCIIETPHIGRHSADDDSGTR